MVQPFLINQSAEIRNLFNSSIQPIQAQRGYQWTTNMALSLFNDVLDVHSGKQSHLSIDLIKFWKDDQGHIHIIDGLQRITTIHLILCALYEVAEKNHNEYLSQHIRKEYLFDRSGNPRFSNPFVNQFNNALNASRNTTVSFANLNSSSFKGSGREMHRAYKGLLALVEKLPQTGVSLEEFTDTLMSGSTFISYQVLDKAAIIPEFTRTNVHQPVDEGTVFVSEVLKTAQSREEDIETLGVVIQDIREGLAESFGDQQKASRMMYPFFWWAIDRHARPRRFASDAVSAGTIRNLDISMSDLIEGLKTSSTWFCSIAQSKEDKSVFLNPRGVHSEALTNLFDWGIGTENNNTYYYQYLTAIQEVSDSQFERLVRLYEKTSTAFTFSTIPYRLNALREVFEGPGKLFSNLHANPHPSDAMVETWTNEIIEGDTYQKAVESITSSQFTSFFDRNPDQIKKVLKRLEKELEGSTSADLNSWEIDHINPVSTNHSDWVDSIGNFVLVPKDLNRRCSAHEFSTKASIWKNEGESLPNLCKIILSRINNGNGVSKTWEKEDVDKWTNTLVELVKDLIL